ncbi:MAG: hypothetical protein ACI87A_000288 [Planctomycetota bacterium]|jgi:hypothetical protein
MKPPDRSARQYPHRSASFNAEGRSRGPDELNRSGEAHKSTAFEARGAGAAVLDIGSDRDFDLALGQGLDACPSSSSFPVPGPGSDVSV